MAAAIMDQVLEGPIAWTRESLSAGDGAVALTPACLAEIREAAAILRENPLPVLAVWPGDFVMPACRRLMTQVRRELDDDQVLAIAGIVPDHDDGARLVQCSADAAAGGLPYRFEFAHGLAGQGLSS